MSRLALKLPVLLAIALLAACGADPADDAGGSGGSGGSGAGGSGGSGGGGGSGGATGCSTLPNDAPQIEETGLAEPLPTPQGGPITDGLYFRSSTTAYNGVGGATGPTGRTFRTTLRFTGDRLEITDGAPDGLELHLAGHFTLAGTAMTLTVECPAGLPVSGQEYTSTAGELLLFNHDGITIDAYTLQ